MLAVSSVAAPPAVGANYFVSPDGDDANPGSLAEPMRSPAVAARKLQPGDTLHFRAGTYRP
ncbi:MAG: hypothetical protein GF393_04990, partial [Armatimonadia bacterium]|nr:hypothetical protein [Armatimonadia bacterium]